MAYRRILATPHVLPLAASSVVARLPEGMTALAFVIFVHDHTGSFGAAGVALAAALPALGVPLLLARRRLLPSPASVSLSA